MLAGLSVSTRYSPSVLCAFAIGKTMYCALHFQDIFAALRSQSPTEPTRVLLHVCVAFRVLCLLALWLIWWVKPVRGKLPTSAAGRSLQSWLPLLQAVYPISICVAVAVLLVVVVNSEVFDETIECGSGMWSKSFFPTKSILLNMLIELMFNPVVSFFILRDARIEIVLTAWLICAGTLYAYCATAAIAYAFFSGILFDDSIQRESALSSAVEQTCVMIAEKEQSACKQAEFMQSLLGNVAHDLKTVNGYNNMKCLWIFYFILFLLSTFTAIGCAAKWSRFSDGCLEALGN